MPLSAPDLAGKVVLVTGGSSGIGREACRAFAAQGAHVALHYFRGRDRAAAIVKEVCDAGGKATAFGADLRSSADIDRLVAAVAATFGKLDVLVNNAGDPIKRVEFADVDEALLDETVAVNFKGPFLLTRRALRLLTESRGVIVNVSTALTRRAGSSGNLHYAAVKGAINVLTLSLAAELAPLGIRANCVAPGAIDTELQARLSDPARLQRTGERALLKRVGTPQEIAEVIVFLASAASAYMTGQIVFADGG